MPNSLNATTRRTALGVIAAAVVPVSAGAMQPHADDPIFPAIAAWREASRIHEAEYDLNGWDGRAEETCKAYHAAAMTMATTEPTSLAGVTALAEYTANDISGGDTDWQIEACLTIANVLRRMAGGTPVCDIYEHHGGYEDEQAEGSAVQ